MIVIASRRQPVLYETKTAAAKQSPTYDLEEIASGG